MKLRCYCLCQIMQIPTTQPDDVRDTASTPMKLGGLGGADCLPMIQQRHPRIAALFVAQLSGQPHTTFLRVASEAPIHLARAGFVAPTWTLWLWTLDHRPGNPKMYVRRGWQHNATSEVEKCVRDEWFMRASVNWFWCHEKHVQCSQQVF